MSKILEARGSHMSMISEESSKLWAVPEEASGRYVSFKRFKVEEISFILLQNKKSDVFSLGCLAFYIFNDGRIDSQSRSVRLNWQGLRDQHTCDGVLAKHLIQIMTLEAPAERRPTVECARLHPFFWNSERILEFLIDISNRLELRDGSSQHVRSLFQQGAEDVINGNWIESLEPAVRASLPHRNRMNYDGSSVENLIRALRNKKNHYDDMSASAQQVVGSLPDGYVAYWTGKFPKLILHVYLKFYESGLYRESNFAQFYPKADKCDVKLIN